MKKNFIIGSLIIVEAFSLIFGFYQKNRADKFEAKLSLELLNKEHERKSMESMMRDEEKKINSMKKELEVKNRTNPKN